jgi:F0F1-type ATP synthase assembly protein I
MTEGPRRDDAWSGLGTGWAIVSTLIAGMLAWGFVGWLLDRVFGTNHVLLAIGIVLGGACGVYIVYLRYGKDDRADD